MSALERVVPYTDRDDPLRVLTRSTVYPGLPNQRREDGGLAEAMHTADGPATLHFARRDPAHVFVRAWGPGAERALSGAAAQLGEDDEPERFETDHPLIAPLLRRHGAPRYGRTGRMMEQLVPAILGQKVTGKGASRSYCELVWRHSERAPGPFEKLWLPPSVDVLRTLAYYDLHPLGVEKKRAMIIFGCVRRARRIERLGEASAEEASEALQRLPGIGPWTTAVVLARTHGDADAVAVGDYHLKNLVAHAFTSEARGTDAQMLELLEPFRPHRARVLNLLSAGGHRPPRFGPRMPVRDIREQ